MTLQPRKRITLQPSANAASGAAAGGAGAAAGAAAGAGAQPAPAVAAASSGSAGGDHRLAMMGGGPDGTSASAAGAGISSATPGALAEAKLPPMGSVKSVATPQRKPAGSAPGSAAKPGPAPSSAGRSPRRRIAPSPADTAALLSGAASLPQTAGAPIIAPISANIATAPSMDDDAPASEPSPSKRRRTDGGEDA